MPSLRLPILELILVTLITDLLVRRQAYEQRKHGPGKHQGRPAAIDLEYWGLVRQRRESRPGISRGATSTALGRSPRSSSLASPMLLPMSTPRVRALCGQNQGRSAGP